MQLAMLHLEVGKVYDEAEVRHLFVDHGQGSTDWGRVRVRFPWPLDDPQGHDHENFRADDEMVVQYAELPVSELAEQIRELQITFAGKPEERDRIEVIKQKYANGEPVFPVFVQSNDRQYRICEGMHRIVALAECGARIVPVFKTGYRDWFQARAIDFLRIPARMK